MPNGATPDTPQEASGAHSITYLMKEMVPTTLPPDQLTKPAIGRKSLTAMGIPGFTTPLLRAQGPGLMVILAKKVAVVGVL